LCRCSWRLPRPFSSVLVDGHYAMIQYRAATKPRHYFTRQITRVQFRGRIVKTAPLFPATKRSTHP
jgi:hypothetical protein